jgi:hypothetical protein
MRGQKLKRPHLILGHLVACCVLWTGTAAIAQPKATLHQKTLDAFNEYVEAFDKSIEAVLSGEKPFLWIQTQDSDVRERARQGDIHIFKSDKNKKIPKGLIHVWGVSVFLAAVKTDDVVELLFDYDRHKDVYPSVIDSKLLGKDGNTVRGYLRFKYKKAITAVLNTEHQAELTRLREDRTFIRVRSTRIAQVAEYGKPEEAEMPIGKDSGFMWRLNTYWFLEQQPDGVYLECQSLTLSRGLPFLLGWIIKPFVNSIPRDSLKELVEGTRIALEN